MSKRGRAFVLRLSVCLIVIVAGCERDDGPFLVPFVSLVARADLFDGLKVRVVGYIAPAPEPGPLAVLYLTKEYAEIEETIGAIYVDVQKEDLACYNGFAEVEGRFYESDGGIVRDVTSIRMSSGRREYDLICYPR